MKGIERRLARLEQAVNPSPVRVLVVDSFNEREVNEAIERGMAPAGTIYVKTGVDRGPGGLYR